jgi:uncharacterized repeat protein (TIGR03803 family)
MNMRTSKGVAVVLLLLKWATSGSSGQTLTTLYQFGSSISNGIALDGSIPEGALVQGSDSNFYGTTHDGGTYGWGTIFRISPSGSYTTLYSFANSSADGANPLAGLVLGRDGNFYGTTLGVRTNVSHGTGLSGNGAVFRISPSGSLTNLHFFDFSDGSNPNTGLIQGSDGNFYGTTYGGGMNAYGTVFKINPSGSFTSLYSFVGYPTDGERPWKLAQGTDGSLYGTTYVGGSNYAGTVFAISPSGTYTSLYSFIGYPKDGYLPDAGLVQGSDGNFYGTTYEGGTNGYGTVFRISPAGKETIIHSFAAIPGDGYQPSAELVQGSDGNLYGTTTAGTVFWISLAGSFSNLYSFGSSIYPQRLVQGSDGNLYGTTTYGGTSTNCGGGCGTVFRLAITSSPPPYPINQITNLQLSSTDIIFNVVSIAGETYQLQFTTDLTSGTWSNIPSDSVTNSIGALLTLTNFGGAVGPQGFYRFAITP